MQYVVLCFTAGDLKHLHQAEAEKSENLFLYIDLPRFDFPVIFSEPVSSLDMYIFPPCL